VCCRDSSVSELIHKFSGQVTALTKCKAPNSERMKMKKTLHIPGKNANKILDPWCMRQKTNVADIWVKVDVFHGTRHSKDIHNSVSVLFKLN